MAQVLNQTIDINAPGDVATLKFVSLVPNMPPFFAIYVPDFAPVATNTLAGFIRAWSNASGQLTYIGDEVAVPYNGRVLVYPPFRIETLAGNPRPWGIAFRTQKFVVPGRLDVYTEDSDDVLPI